MYCDREKYKDSELNYKRALEFKPDITKGWNNIGLMYTKQKVFEEAE